jgi:hypothetical protein
VWSLKRQEIEMNTIMKLTAAALGAASIAGGVAVAQSTTADPNDHRAETANYGTPPGAPLKRDGSLGSEPEKTAPAAAATDTSSTTSTTTTSTTNWNNPPAAAPAATEPVAATPSYTATDNTTTAYKAPRADRN